MFSIVAKQMLIMGVFMISGALLFKSKLVTKEGCKTLTNILIYVITPAAVFRSFCTECTPKKLQALGISILLCALVQGFGILFSHITYKKRPLEQFAASFGNVGFFGIPVIQACLGTEAVFFIAPLVVYTGTLQHSYGVSLLLGKQEKFDWKRLLLAPNLIGFFAGLLVFLSGLGTKMPVTVTKCVDLVANMSAFFAMTILGIFFIQADLKQIYKNIDIYIISAIRLLIVPILCAFMFKFIPVNNAIKIAILLGYSTPIGSNVANYSLLYNKDYGTASLYVSISTILCLFTMPLFVTLAESIIS